MSLEIDALLRPYALDGAGDISAALATTYVLLDRNGWTLPRALSVDAFFSYAVGANYARALNVDAALSTTLQSAKVGGTASALALATTKVQLGTGASHLVGFYGATPIVRAISPASVTVGATFGANEQAVLQAIATWMANAGIVQFGV